MILYGIKRTENRNMLPEPREGRAAISCSKSFCKEEFGRLIAWASVNLPSEDFEKLPSWREVKDWSGRIIAVCDYKARDGLIWYWKIASTSPSQRQSRNGTKVIGSGGTSLT